MARLLLPNYTIHAAWALAAMVTEVVLPDQFALFPSLTLVIFSLGVAVAATGWVGGFETATDQVVASCIVSGLQIALPIFNPLLSSFPITIGILVIGILGCLFGPGIVGEAIETGCLLRRRHQMPGGAR